ncbi:MAG: hypothetical protein GF334_09445 [Candidatus Altiarchaeales archaeon]|nr:hypothetical protein [Candidatus Altiarchaeales archaeon]
MKREFKVFGIGLFIVFVVGFSLLGDSPAADSKASPALNNSFGVSGGNLGCQTDHREPGFRCPNARLPSEGEDKKLTEKCSACANHALNGGACPGKYI